MPADEYDEQSFPEFLYLDAFTDVRDAVASGALRNGWEHYVRYGRAEIEAQRRPSPFAGGRLDMMRSVLPPASSSEPVPPSPAPVMHTASADAIPYMTPPAPALRYPSEDALFDPALYLAVNPDLPARIAAGEVAGGGRALAGERAGGNRSRATAEHYAGWLVRRYAGAAFGRAARYGPVRCRDLFPALPGRAGSRGPRCGGGAGALAEPWPAGRAHRAGDRAL